MAKSKIEQEIESLRYDVEQLTQISILHNSDVIADLHSCYEKLVSLTLQLPSYTGLYLETLLEDGLLYLEEQAYTKARTIFLKVKKEAEKTGTEYDRYKVQAYVNLPATYTIKTGPEQFFQAVDNAIQSVDSYLRTKDKENPDVLYLYSESILRLARILYDNSLFEQAIEFSREAFRTLEQVVLLKERIILKYANSAAEWIPLYKEQNNFTGIISLCRVQVNFSANLADARYYFTIVCILNEIASEYVEEKKQEEAKTIFQFLQEIYKNNEAILKTVLRTSSVSKNRKLNGEQIIKRANKNYKKLYKKSIPELFRTWFPPSE